MQANYTSLKSVTFWKVYNFRVHVYKGVPLYACWSSILVWRVSHFEKCTLTYASVKLHNFRVPIYKGVPLPWMKWNPSFNDDCWPSIVVWKGSNFEKWASISTTLEFPLIRGVPFPWKRWNPSFNDDCWPSILVWTVSNFEKWALMYTTLGFPVIRGFPSHGWNETRPLTKSAGQL